ncbi:MAG TPA: hypothetical protein VE953_26265, partial [Terriglobales bacterium]|nr:hypothetical protein [Terriglobales bacterium]
MPQVTGRRLFHYTALHHAEEIRASGGITRGAVPIPSADGQAPAGLAPGWQWLTSDPDWAQGWATRQVVTCDRTECRFVVLVPLEEMDRLFRWDRTAVQFGYDAETAARFAALGTGSDPARWWLFKGSIPAAWLV